jgi:hypothetical protein
MNDTPRKNTVTLEDLLRVKRAEQPPAEFWGQFEQGLRAKQLAAIVEPRPWWAPFIRVGARLSRYQLPVGATAILAITLFTIREYQPATQGPVFEQAAERASLTPSGPVEGKTSAVDAVTVPVAMSTAAVAVADPAPANVTRVSRTEPAAPATATSVGTSSHVAMIDAELSSARYMADNPAMAKATESNLDQMLGHSLRTADTPVRGEPLAQISVSGESPLYRWQGGAVQTASLSTGDSALRVDEHTTRRLTERRLSESDVTSRLAVGVDRLIVKF